MEQIKVVIPKEKLNDFNFIYGKLMDVKLEVIKTISQQTGNDFYSLLGEFVPELIDFDNSEVLEKHGIDKSNLGGKKVEPSEKTSETKPVKKIIKKIIKPSSSVNKQYEPVETSVVDEIPIENNVEKPVEDTNVPINNIENTTQDTSSVKKKKIIIKKPIIKKSVE